jgi:hypothetical protein
MKSIRLIRGPHRFEVRYEPGCESRVLDQLVRWVNSPSLPFDWFDAAILSQQVGQELVKDLGAYLPKGGEGIKA